jgi:hypothetical protein
MGILPFSCKKEVGQFENNNDYPKVIDINPGRTIIQYEIADGGSMIIYNPMIGLQRDVSVSILDAAGKVLRTTSFGGTRNEFINQAVRDDDGNIYVAGGTSSPELRMDPLKDEKDAEDGYIAKIDKEGNLVWQRGYCNVNSLQKGVWDDEFGTIALVNGKLYCVGETPNEQPISPNSGTIDNWDTWLVVFDENGNVLKDMILPAILKRGSALGFGGGTFIDAIHTQDNNLVIRFVYQDYLSQRRVMDTTTLLCKFNTATDQVMWKQYFLRTSLYGDIVNFGQLGNGNLVGFDSYYNSISTFDSNTGNPISHRVIGNNIGSSSSTIFLTRYRANNFKVGDDFYVVGWMNIGGGTADLKPWMIKLDKQGNTVYNKTLPINSASLYWIQESANHNLKLSGKIAVFGTLLDKLFTFSITPDGEMINENNN